AYQNTSQRFAALQQLITMIGAAGDTKAIQDLQGRVNSEQAMLQNEQTKLQTLYQMAQADQWAQQQRLRERSISDVGSVSSLAPVPNRRRIWTAHATAVAVPTDRPAPSGTAS